jgi:AraC-like DNA-binding protein
LETKLYRDFDDFTETVGDVDCRMTMNRPGRNVWSLTRVSLPDVHVQIGSVGSGNIIEGQALRDGYLFYLPLTADCAYSANGQLIGRDAFLVLEPGCDFVLSTADDHDWCAFSVPNHQLDPGFRHLLPSPGEPARSWISRPSLALAGAVRSRLGDLAEAARIPDFDTSPAARNAAAAFSALGTHIVAGRGREENVARGRPPLSRSRIVRRVMAALRKTDRELPDFAGLASHAGVSERTLRTVFKEYFGVGPNRYLRLRRLQSIRRALKAADPATTSVSEVLVRHGEWQFGRVAGRYKTLFGESPSATLNQSAGVRVR